jgi:rieske iron-sulfur protein
MREGGKGSDCACRYLAGERSTRRGFLALLSFIGLDLAVVPALADPASERPKEGDFLVSIENESTNALALKDVPLGGPPVLAWPMDPVSNTVRKESRLNKIVLLRFEPAALNETTKERAIDGVVAYSAICPHAGCEVSGWAADQQLLECSCHYSHYDPRAAAAVVDGPAPRPLAALPLKTVDGKLAVAKPFTGRVGIVPT